MGQPPTSCGVASDRPREVHMLSQPVPLTKSAKKESRRAGPWPLWLQAPRFLDAGRRAHIRREGACDDSVRDMLGHAVPEFKWSSQHLERGGCDDCSEAAFGSVWAKRVALAWSA